MAEQIILNSLEKSFFTLRGRVDVLKGVSLTIRPEEFFVLLGPSGCGKSTLLNLIAGLETPSGGAITIGDTAVADTQKKLFVDPFHRNIAMVFQSYALYPHMSVHDNIAFPLTNLKPRLSKAAISSKVRKTAELLKIADLLDRKPAELSGGQRQRVAIGRAVVREPRVFLMDEPLSNLDAQLRMEMRAQIKELQRRLGITTVYVTHDQMEAMTLGDRIAILNQGTIQQLGTPTDVYDNPSNVFVARFIGSPPMNLFMGEVKREGDSVTLATVDGGVMVPPQVVSRLSSAASCTLGIRPEHIDLVEPGQGNVDAAISVVENIGSEFLAYMFLKQGQVVVRTPSRPATGPVGLRFVPEKVHVFE